MDYNALKIGGGRNHSIDLLKILSMIMVVILHLNLFGGLIISANQSSNYLFKFIVHFYEEICIVAVDVFIIISSWFLSAKRDYTLKSHRIIRLLLSMFFWYFVATTIAYALGIHPEYKELLASLPLIGKSYDFIAGYLVLFFLSPFLNRLTRQLNNKSHKKLAIGLFTLFCLMAPIIYNQYLMVNKGYSFAWFVCIFLIISYVRKYVQWDKFSWKFYLIVFVILTLIGTLARCLPSFGITLYISKGHYNGPIVFLSAISCFLLFSSITIKRKKGRDLIQFFVPLSVAVFFIHANMFIEQWFKSLAFYTFINEKTLLYVISVPLIAIIVYIVCTMCEFLREIFFSKIGIYKVIDKMTISIDKHLIF